jgi:hypothetical protein
MSSGRLAAISSAIGPWGGSSAKARMRIAPKVLVCQHFEPVPRFLTKLRERARPSIGIALAAVGVVLAIVLTTDGADEPDSPPPQAREGPESVSACERVTETVTVRRGARAEAQHTAERQLTARETATAEAELGGNPITSTAAATVRGSAEATATAEVTAVGSARATASARACARDGTEPEAVSRARRRAGIKARRMAVREAAPRASAAARRNARTRAEARARTLAERRVAEAASAQRAKLSARARSEAEAAATERVQSQANL